MLRKLFLLITMLSTAFTSSLSYASPKTIQLNTTNVLSIRGTIDDAVAKVENYAIKLVEWCWHSRVNILHKKRRKKNVTRRNNNNT